MTHNDMTRYDEMIGEKPGQSRTLIGNIPTTYHQASDKLSAASRLMLISLLLITMLTGGAVEAWGQVITPTTDPSNPVYYLFQSFGNTAFYMRPDGTGKVSTSNILTDDMKWYFLDSGDGYYYICDKDGNYLYFSKPSGSQSSRTWMELKNSLDNDDKAHYKFSIAKNNTKGWNAYNIIPYGNEDKYCLNKQGRNAGTNGVQVSNGWDDENSNWVFIPMTDYVWTLRPDCFRPSDSSNKYFYKIKSKVDADASYYIKPGTTYVETSNTVDDDMIWYFEEASSDDYMTYYYIRLANDGQYLRYRSTAGGQDNAIELASHTGSETGDAEDRFQFIVVRGAVSNEPWNTTDISYNIVPKLLKRTNNNINFFCVSSNKGLGKPLKTRNDRAATDNKWTFVSVDFPTICAKPTITYSNTTGKASITTTTTRSTIYYTTDGSEPSSSNGTYTIPFAVNEQTTIKAFVTRTGFSDSEVTTKTIYKVATPSIENTEASVISITTATSGATIYYTTDGSEPTTSSTPYTEPVTITASSVTIKAIAVKDGMINSAVSSEYFAFSCPTPTISFDNTTNTVTIASETGSTIYYAYGSTNPADPTVDEGVAHGSSPVTFTISAKTYIKALAIKEGLGNSAVQSATIDKVSAPVIDITSDGKVKLTSSTTDVTIYYEIGDDASSVTTPTTSSTRYTSPLSNVAGKVIKAIAVKDGWITSDIGGSEGPITLQCAMPVIRRGTGNTFTISCSFPTEGVHIYYTTGNGDPTTLYEGPVSIAAYPVTIKAIARADGYNDSSLAEETITQDLELEGGYYLIASAGDFEKFVTMANSTGAGDKYKVVDNFTVSGNTTVSTTFTGTFEGSFDDESGEYFTISGLHYPLFNSTDGAVIKNVILKDVQISQDGPVGAIAGTASGYTRIYNCGILPSDNKFAALTQSSVKSSDGYCGGLVGWLKDDSRVINCFSYANITGGTDVAGIVGHNEAVYTDSGTGYGSTTQTNNGSYYRLKTAVVNCMFYGNITSGTNRWPVYGGAMMRNDTDNGINNYDFYRAEASLGLADDSHYNCSWPAKEEYLTQYEFHRYLLNSNRELCGWWVGAPSAPSGMSTSGVQAVAKDASLIAKWVLDPSIAPYPILKTAGKYPSVINQAPRPGETNPQRIDSETKQWGSRATASTEWTNPKAAPETEGQTLGSISVTIQDGDEHDATDITRTFTITAMDIENNDFCYGKIQLPYYNSIFGDPSVEVDPNESLANRQVQWNSRYGGNYNDKVVVGWEITDVTGGIENVTDVKKEENSVVVFDHTFSEDAESGYNFADRYCTTKDEERVFAQGGYYYVPYGVTAITITAKWATAIYLDNSANHDYDKVHMSAANAGKQFLPAGTRPTTLANGESVTTDNINNVIPSGGSVYENAIVLVGNHQYRRGKADIKGADSDGCTIMSADFDMDEEPDYCLIWQLGQGTDRQSICPIRFDFLPIVEMGLAMKENGSTNYYSLGCYRPLGHYEVTETSLIRFGQFEFGNSSRTSRDPLILNGGIFEQYCKGTKSNTNAEDYINYIIIGGNVYMPSFTPGAHVNTGAKYPTRHCPVNVIGGNIDYVYLTGNYNEGVSPNTDNPHCYIDGGNFEHIAAAGKEGINGDVYFNINHSVIQEFYGGSTMDKADGNNFKIVKGNIDVTIDNSMVAKYCGGPKFGDMVSGKTVTTRATGTTFGVYYGGGNGGTSYVQYASTDKTVDNVTAGTYSWTTNDNDNGKLDGYTPGSYRSGNGNQNYMADYEMEIVNTSAGTDAKKAVFRTYFFAAQFSATNTGSITNNLTDCTVLTNFYGAGNLGGVNGNVTSTLAGTTRVIGSAFGAGFSAKAPEVTIYEKDKEYPTINIYTGIITPTPENSGSKTTYTWTHETSVGGNTLSTSNPKALNVEGKNYFYTEKSLQNLGAVSGAVTLTIKGNTIVESKVFNEDGTVDNTKIGGVYGGGDASGVINTTTPANASTTVNLQGNAQVYGNVFGGGNEGAVSGSTEVNIQE